MENIILNNGIKIKIKNISIGALQIIMDNSKTVEELEKIFTKDNLKTLKVENSEGIIYGNFYNMQCISITKNITNCTIFINLEQLTK